MRTIIHVSTTTTDVRIAVATFESIPATPTFARIAVIAANSADKIDHPSQFILLPLTELAEHRREVDFAR
jgi:hypothetical protein